jgi:hypothetical protein
MFIDKATIAFSNELQVSQTTETTLALRQRYDADDEWSEAIFIGPDELNELVTLARTLGWEV